MGAEAVRGQSVVLPLRGAAQTFFCRWYFWATHSRLKSMIEKARMLKRYLPNHHVLEATDHQRDGGGPELEDPVDPVHGFLWWSVLPSASNQPESCHTGVTVQRKSLSGSVGWRSRRRRLAAIS